LRDAVYVAASGDLRDQIERSVRRARAQRATDLGALIGAGTAAVWRILAGVVSRAASRAGLLSTRRETGPSRG